jgi:NDP-sugar pyrophosphorylase family protein
MKVDHSLVLAAGKGTRMGPIGEELPKVIWPVFEKSILELEVLYAKKLGAGKVHTNIYNYPEKLLPFIKQHQAFDDVNILVEEDAIDIGGAIHNLASKLDYTGNLLVLNSDQFIMFNESVFKAALKSLENHDVVLFSYDVNSNAIYNKLSCDNKGDLVGVVPNKELPRNVIHETYTGLSLIKLESLRPTPGKSSFFESVANPKERKVSCVNIGDSVYWDFGTIKRYHDSLFRILDKINSRDPFIQFIKNNNVLDENKIDGNTYGSVNNSINLTSEEVKIGEKTILLKSSLDSYQNVNNSIIYESIIQEVSAEEVPHT